MKYAMWFDNGSGHFDGYKETDDLTFDQYQYRQVITEGWEFDPNQDESFVIADSLRPDERPDALLVGRHVAEELPYNVVRQKAVTFSADLAECTKQIEELFEEAYEGNLVLLFQNIPGTVACVMCRIARQNPPTHLNGVGVVISKPGERPANKIVEFDKTAFSDEMRMSAHLESFMLDIVQQANPNARIADGKIVVDPTMKFVFDRVEWLF